MPANLAEARRRTSRRTQVPTRPDFFPFDGGLNLLDSPFSVKPGECSSALNYEIDIAGGYRRIAGYRHYDGSPSVDDSAYNLLGYGASSRFSLSSGDSVVGNSSSANAAYLTRTEEGGYGLNAITYNETFEDATWVKLDITAADGDLAWSGGLADSFSKISESTDALDKPHHISQSSPITIAIGDRIYASVFVKPAASQIDALRITVSANAVVWGSTGQSAIVDFNLNTFARTNSVYVEQSGVDSLGSGVYRLWLITRATIAASTGNLFFQTGLLVGSTVDVDYTGTGRYLHMTGAMAVALPVGSPHNTVAGTIFSGNWTATNTVITDGDLFWGAPTSTQYYFEFTKIADTTDAGATHSIAADNMVDVRVGDVLYVDFYARFTSGQNEGIAISLTGDSTDNWDGAVLNASFNISLGTVTLQSAAVDSATITAVTGNIYRITLTSVPATAPASLGLRFTNGQQVSPDTLNLLYAGSGKYTHIIGVRCQCFPEGHQTIRMGYVNTVASSKNVKSGNLVLSSVTSGPYTDDEDLAVSSTVVAQAVGVESENSETDTSLDSAYMALAAANATGATAPTGSGAIRGVWEYNGNTYCFRDNSGATAGQMFKATSGGWSLITLNDRLNFDNGDDATTPVEGDTLAGVTSGASAKILRIVLTSGTWGVDAAGYFILGTVTSGPFQNNEQLQVSAADVALADGANAAQTLAAGGRYEFRNNNFYGASDKYRMYGVNGVGKAFEYDDHATDSFYCEIDTGMTTDTPTHLAVHNYHLFLSFPGGSVQLSGDGNPVSWTVITGASEIAVGADITGFIEEVSNSLLIVTRNRTYVLNGNTRANFDLDDFNVNAGGHEWSIERIGMGTFLDDRGFTVVRQTSRGDSINYQEDTVSAKIQPLISDLIANTSVKAVHLIRNRNIYRCYFADGRVVSIGFRGHKVAGHMTLEYPFIANCAVSGEDSSGAEVVFVGASDGKVYQLETGTSFDGEALRAFMRSVLYHSRSPTYFKKYRQCRLDAQLFGALTMKGRMEYDFHEDGFNLGVELDFTTDEAGGYWDDFNWDNFTWDKSTSGIPQQKLEGEGVNAAVYLHTESTSDPVHVLRGMSLQWTPRRSDRRN